MVGLWILVAVLSLILGSLAVVGLVSLMGLRKGGRV